MRALGWVNAPPARQGETYDPIEHLAKTVFCSIRWGETRLVMLTAAFDASGHEGQDLVAVAGFISSANDWINFDRIWRYRLSQDGLSYFRVSELTHGSQFREWTSERRNKLMEDLISIIQIHAYRKFGCFVINQTFATLPKDQREDWGMTAYALAGRTVASYVQHWALKEPAGSIPPIEYVFEDGDKGEGKLREL